jgi:hypothetical protein
LTAAARRRVRNSRVNQCTAKEKKKTKHLFRFSREVLRFDKFTSWLPEAMFTDNQ